MIGCTSTFTLGTIRRARYARDKGADAIQIAVPFWMELQDSEIQRFFTDVAIAVPDIAISIYETTRAKRAIPLEVHQWIHETIPNVLMVKSNINTLGHSKNGCAEINKLYNVFVGEDAIFELGPYGAIGSCSSLIYMNPRLLLEMFECRYRQDWVGVKRITDMINRVLNEGLAHVFAKGCEDSALDRLLGLSTGFLHTSLHCRAPYTSCSADDLAQLQRWLQTNLPEFLDL